MQVDLSIILVLRNAEPTAARFVRNALAIAQNTAPPEGEAGDLGFELLALDESSGDNTLSVLSLLHAQVAQLRTFQDLPPGTAVKRGARVARGKVWMVMDHAIDLDLGVWGLRQVLCGHRAALVPGELLAVERGLGEASLGWLEGGLVRAQREVRRNLQARGEQPAFSPPQDRGLRKSAELFIRGRLPRFAARHVDRPIAGGLSSLVPTGTRGWAEEG